ncbi:MAG: hypothetical protein I4O51_04775 [Flavobacterium micromati]|nr:hypothetical protein [Flavobacterium micromati]
MTIYFKIIKANFFQFVNGRTFFILLVASIFVAISFIPPPEANYTTMRFGSYIGEYNVQWVGTVGAIMASIFLSFFGFFFVIGSITKDFYTKVGQIIAATQISNFSYLLLKAINNFLVLLAILFIVSATTVVIFFSYNEGHNFNLFTFLKPYIYITVPSIFFIAFLAVIIEIVFPKKVFLQYIVFFFFFCLMLFDTSSSQSPFFLDFFGIKSSTEMMHNQVLKKTDDSRTTLSLGFIAGKKNVNKKIVFDDLNFDSVFILKRSYLALFFLLGLYISSIFFHRFNLDKYEREEVDLVPTQQESAGFQLNAVMVATAPSFKIMPLVFSELLLIVRKNENWVSGLSLIGIVAICFVPIRIAHGYLLPLLWLLQVSSISELILKEKINRAKYLTSTSVNPIGRAFTAKVLSGIILVFSFAVPLIFRYLWQGEFYKILGILFGIVFIVSLSILLGLITKTQKTFEIVFLLLTYCNLNMISGLDYLGAYHDTWDYALIMFFLTFLILSFSYLLKYLRNE